MTTPQPHEVAYAAYKAAPGPETLHSVVQSLKPTIGYALAAAGAADDPLVQAKALLHAANAVESYDPSFGAALPTHVAQGLRQLSREARKSRSPISLPERTQLDSYQLYKATKAFQDQHDREPDTLELADATGLSVKRIAKIRSQQMLVPSESQVGDVAQEGPDYHAEALDYVYHDADHTDRRILELKTGYGGHQVMSPKDVAIKLKLTPSQLSRRAQRMAMKIQRIHDSLAS